MSGNFLNYLKGVKEPFGAQEGRWYFSRDTAAEKGLSSHGGENLLVFLELRWGSSRDTTGTSGTRSWGLREVQSPCESRGAPQDTSAVTAGADVLIWSGDRNLRFPLQGRHGSQGFSGASTGEAGPRLLWSDASPLSCGAGKAVSGFMSG